MESLAVKTDECVVLVHERLSIVGLGTVIPTLKPDLPLTMRQILARNRWSVMMAMYH